MSAIFDIVTRPTGSRANLHGNMVQITSGKLGRGLKLDYHKKAPVVLLEHGELPFPIGLSERNGKHLIRRQAKKATAEVVFWQKNADARMVFAAVDDGILRMSSIGFMPVKARAFQLQVDEELAEGVEDLSAMMGGGLDFTESQMLEWSIVASGADPDAFKQTTEGMLQILSAGHLHGEKMTRLMKGIFQRITGPQPAKSTGFSFNTDIEGSVGPAIATQILDLIEQEATTADEFNTEEGSETALFAAAGRTGSIAGEELAAVIRKDTSKFVIQQSIFTDDADVKELVSQHVHPECSSCGFNPNIEYVEPATMEYDWCARFVGCEVKELFNVGSSVERIRMGSFLVGLKHQLADWEVKDTRNLTRQGKEIPPRYSTIRLNSKSSDDFLMSGLNFLSVGDKKIVVKYDQTYYGIRIEIYAKIGDTTGSEILGKALDWMIEHNFLKGEAFTLLGDFLERKETQMSDLILDQVNKDSVDRLVQRLSSKKELKTNRGMIFMGPPGTGKTLSGRVIKDQSPHTFIWVSARDFLTMGASYGFEVAFDLAHELAPAILFIEDIDNFMTPHIVDLLKTEMDGIGKDSGITTILTTNYPERIPQTLIDRPGRFDEILKFDVPGELQRKDMLSRWLRVVATASVVEQSLDADNETMSALVDQTEGYSGAHIFELTQYAIEVFEGEEKLTLSQAAMKAVDKIEKQKQLIYEAQVRGDQDNSRFGKMDADQLKHIVLPFQEEQQVQQVEELMGISSIAQNIVDRCELQSKISPGTGLIAERLSVAVTEVLDEFKDEITKTVEQSVSFVIQERLGVLLDR